MNATLRALLSIGIAILVLIIVGAVIRLATTIIAIGILILLGLGALRVLSARAKK